MAKEALVDNHVSLKQCDLAVNALFKHVSKVQEQRAEHELLPGKEQNVWLVITVKHVHPEKKLMPARIPVVHPIVDPRKSSVCLITKDPQREYKDLLEAKGVRFISRVVGVEKLKGKFKPFEARRMLLKENDLFLADERVIPVLPGLLGKEFFKAKKQPIPVCLTRKDLKGELERGISSTYFHQNKGTCTSIKIGTVSHNPSQILDNLKAAIPEVAKKVKGGWDNVQSLHIKTNSSASLPIWACKLGDSEGARWDGLTIREAPRDEAGLGSEGEGEDEAAAEPEKKKKAPTKAKGKAAEQEKEVTEPAASKKSKGKERAAENGAGKPQKKAKADPVPEASKQPADKKSSPAAIEAAAPADDAAKKSKKRKAEAPPSTSTAVPAKKSKKQAPSESGPSSDTATASSTLAPVKPATGAVFIPAPQDVKSTAATSAPKKTRASAVDFFEDAPSSSGPVESAAQPASDAPKKRKKGKVAEVAQSTDATSTPASATEPALSAEAITKKAKKGKAAAADASARAKSAPAADATPVSKDELKKKRAATGLEKKKGKALADTPAKKSAKKSAKQEVVGKKRHA